MKRTRIMKFNNVMDYWMWLRKALLNDIYEGRKELRLYRAKQLNAIMGKDYVSQLIFVSSVNTAQTFLRDNWFKPQYVKGVENLIKKWTVQITDKGLIKMMNDLQQEELNQFK